MKNLVETTGDFMLVDRQQGLEIQSYRPAVAERTQFVDIHLGSGRLRVLSQLRDEATDEEFQRYVEESGGDVALAVDSFLSVYGPEAVTTKEEAPVRSRGRGRGRKRTAE